MALRGLWHRFTVTAGKRERGIGRERERVCVFFLGGGDRLKPERLLPRTPYLSWLFVTVNYVALLLQSRRIKREQEFRCQPLFCYFLLKTAWRLPLPHPQPLTPLSFSPVTQIISAKERKKERKTGLRASAAFRGLENKMTSPSRSERNNYLPFSPDGASQASGFVFTPCVLQSRLGIASFNSGNTP